jgi:hypothetical protein
MYLKTRGCDVTLCIVYYVGSEVIVAATSRWLSSRLQQPVVQQKFTEDSEVPNAKFVY